MKKIVLFFLTLCAINFSCTKQVKVPVSYAVSNDVLTSGVFDIYMADTGTYDMAVLVKFLTGSTQDSVKLSISGVPANVSVTPSSFGALPTYTEDFIFTSLNASLGTHPVTITATVAGEAPKTYSFNIIVLPANAATIFLGGLNTTNACSSSDYSYVTTGSISDTTGINVLYLNNFGGYGPDANARVLLDPVHNTVSLPQQTIGNGVRLSGSGSYTQTTLTINYSAVVTPGAVPDNCTATITN